MYPRWKRLLLFGPLLTAGFMGLAGCLYIPTFNVVVEGEDVSSKVGEADSKRKLRLDEATREDVYRVLGPPQYATADQSQVLYRWTSLKGFWLGICFGVHKDRAEGGLFLSFDENGVLRSMESRRYAGGFSSFFWGAPAWFLMPVEMLPYPLATTRPLDEPVHPSAPSEMPPQDQLRRP